ncbi:hypothetical protein BX070DRAFT_226702 [Coemansia spiralis]|nr:hypothetical protein BX070DRAFT_226702 [Coemansia spiralis]
MEPFLAFYLSAAVSTCNSAKLLTWASCLKSKETLAQMMELKLEVNIANQIASWEGCKLSVLVCAILVNSILLAKL